MLNVSAKVNGESQLNPKLQHDLRGKSSFQSFEQCDAAVTLQKRHYHETPMGLSWLRPSSGLYSQHYACMLIPKTQGSASCSPPSYAFSSNFASCLYANIRNYDSILCASWWLWRASVCELAWRNPWLPATHNHPRCHYLSILIDHVVGNLISMITNTITQTWDWADLGALTRGLSLCGFGALELFERVKYENAIHANHSHSMSGHGGAKTVHTYRVGLWSSAWLRLGCNFLNAHKSVKNAFENRENHFVRVKS